MLKNFLLWLIIVTVLIMVFSNFAPERTPAEQKVSYSQFLQDVNQGNVSSVTIVDDRVIHGTTENNKLFQTYMPINDQYLLSDLIKNNVEVVGKPPQQESLLMHIFINWFPVLLIIGVWIFFMRQAMQGGIGGRGGALSFGRSRARLLGEDQVKNYFLRMLQA